MNIIMHKKIMSRKYAEKIDSKLIYNTLTSVYPNNVVSIVNINKTPSIFKLYSKNGFSIVLRDIKIDGNKIWVEYDTFAYQYLPTDFLSDIYGEQFEKLAKLKHKETKIALN